jgi:NAD(P)-dependent dehydrogenase (short-subunit alcohol dehydrogenase family)
VGGSRGIGQAVAELLAAHGAGVVVNGREPDAASLAADAITAHGGRAIAHAGSPSNDAAADALIDACVQTYGRIDILVNCAGILEPRKRSILEITSADFNAVLEAHLGTVFHACRAAAPVMVEQGGGSIVNTSRWPFSATSAAPGIQRARVRSIASLWRWPPN